MALSPPNARPEQPQLFPQNPALIQISPIRLKLDIERLSSAEQKDDASLLAYQLMNNIEQMFEQY
jgi:hypothetical protein